MKILETLIKNFNISEELENFQDTFNDIIIDCTSSLKVINSSLLCKSIPRIIKLTTENIETTKNSICVSSFEDAINMLTPDDRISVIIVDDLSFLKDEQLKYFLSLQNYTILSFTDLKSFEIQNPLCEGNVKYELSKETKNDLFIFNAL